MQLLEDFIESIPHEKLEAPFRSGTVYQNQDFRLDNQGLTSGDPRSYNLQIQANKESSNKALRKLKGRTVAGPVFSPVDDPKTPENIRELFLGQMRI